MYKFKRGKSAKKKKKQFNIRFIYGYSTVDKSFDKNKYMYFCSKEILFYCFLMNLLHTFKQCLSCQGLLIPHFLVFLFLVADSIFSSII